MMMNKELIATGCMGVFSVVCSILFIESTTFYKILFSVVSISGTLTFFYNIILKALNKDTTTKLLNKIDETNKTTTEKILKAIDKTSEEIKTINLTMLELIKRNDKTSEEIKTMNSTMLELIKTLKK